MMTAQRLSDDALIAIVRTAAHLQRSLDALKVELPTDDYDAAAALTHLGQSVEHLTSFVRVQAKAE